MAVTEQCVAAEPLTYEAYLAEGEVMRRYDIVDGVRIWMTNPTRLHQRILRRIARLLEDYEVRSGRGETIIAPADVLISRVPLRTRQPDVLFISHEQLAKCAPPDDPQPLLASPELVVETLSPSETRRKRMGKIEDYRGVGVQECWVVSPTARTVEVLRLGPDGVESIAVYQPGQELRSLAFPDLALFVSGFFPAFPGPGE